MGHTMDSFLDSTGLGGLGRNDARDYNPRAGDVAIPATGQDEPRRLPDAVFKAVRKYCDGETPKSHMVICESFQRHNMKFSTVQKSHLDCHISWRGKDGELKYGRIFSIFGEAKDGCPKPITSLSIDRIFLAVEQYAPLSATDERLDPYRTHPMLGAKGYNLCRVVYNAVLAGLEVIESEAVVGHVAVCPLDPGHPATFQRPALVTMQLDKVCQS